ncbi:MAG TPA: arylamine N-acetyltransferase [Pirellulales bacterium]|nr:arylamine N-acetyltransferase [Pirellulales bacterium]
MTDLPAAALDLDAYFRRIGYTGPRQATPEVLDAVHLAHATSIPFENLDIQLGRPIGIDLASIQAKLVKARRGGYCFEQNTLLAAVLERLGFHVTPLAARVRLGAHRVLPRTHMMLMVDVAGQAWLADVGFGTGGLLEPIRLRPGGVSRQFGWSFRLVEERGVWVLESLREGAWQPLYVFTLEPHYALDFEMANHYVSTHPASRFVQTLAVQRQTPEACYLLRNRELTVIKDGNSDCRQIVDAEALLAVLAETFGLEFPPGTRFRCLSDET